ncbi:MAG: glycosyltransferase [Chloroflexi bacterium]|nr:glycosyltransferase [Chloroflexota bacterium]
MTDDRRTISIVIPAYRAQGTIGACLDALRGQTAPDDEVIVVADDESRETVRALGEPRGARVLTPNRGAAAARNLGAADARGEIVLFLDADCVPERNWVRAMLAPFADPEIVGACGMKQTKQRGIIPRFIQIEFDYRYDNERALPHIDFIDSGTAGYRRAIFLEQGGFDSRLSDAEDTDLSYRLAERGYKMAFASDAIVYHHHPEALIEYLRRKFTYAFWRADVYARHPRKLASDSRTPQTQKIQGVLVGSLVGSLVISLAWRDALWLAALIVIAFALTTLPFITRYFQRDPVVVLLSPWLIALSALAGSFGLGLGFVRAKLKRET